MEQVTIRLDAFEGPMDLLYHLIEKNEIDIYDIPIASLTELGILPIWMRRKTATWMV